MAVPDADVGRVLVVAAHPDDTDFAAAGTVARWTSAGIEVTYLLCTYGDAGGHDDTPRFEVPALRAAEQRAAARTVGVTDVRFLTGYRDGYLEATPDLVRDVVRVIRELMPDRVVCPSPQRWWERLPASHPDHLACGEATVRAVYPAARNRFAFPELLDEGLEPWTVPEMWLAAHPTRNHWVEITDVLDRKMAALRAHASQTSHLGDELDRFVREAWGALGAEAGLGPDRYAEGFFVVTSA